MYHTCYIIELVLWRCEMKERIQTKLSEIRSELESINQFLYDFPEEGYQEFKACKILSDTLEKHGFTVERGIYEIETAFRGTYNGKKEGPNVAFLCEYDALPEIGHGCGHNIIASIGVGAAIALKSVIDEVGGNVFVFGTPAEETSGAKVEMVRRHAFDDMSAVLMAHPSPINQQSGTSLALNALQFEYIGKPAHAAQVPEKGINALDSVILLFNGINALRQHVPTGVRMHGIITKGGVAPNVVPEHAVARFYIRAPKKDLRDEVTKKVVSIAEGAGKMTGAKLNISNYEESYDDLRTNQTLSKLFVDNLKALGETEIEPPSALHGSLDLGNISYVAPCIHPYIGLDDASLVTHTREFAACSITDKGKSAIYKGAASLAMTAYDLLESKDIQQQVRSEFEKL